MKKHLFTLVELLVVVGIIALLAGLIIPAVGMAQTSARRTACLSNQGQVMKIMRAYMNEGDAQFLPNWYNSSSNKYLWTQALYNAGKIQNDISFARCPAIIPSSDAQISNESDASLAEAYGMVYSDNANAKGINYKSTKGLKYGTGSSAFMVAANQMALGGCSARLSSSDQVVGRSLIHFDPNNTVVNDTAVGRPALVHGDQANIFFLDGHAESFTKDTLHQKRYFTNVTGADAREAVKIAGSNNHAKWAFNPDEEE